MGRSSIACVLVRLCLALALPPTNSRLYGIRRNLTVLAVMPVPSSWFISTTWRTYLARSSSGGGGIVRYRLLFLCFSSRLYGNTWTRCGYENIRKSYSAMEMVIAMRLPVPHSRFSPRIQANLQTRSGASRNFALRLQTPPISSRLWTPQLYFSSASSSNKLYLLVRHDNVTFKFAAVLHRLPLPDPISVVSIKPRTRGALQAAHASRVSLATSVWIAREGFLWRTCTPATKVPGSATQRPTFNTDIQWNRAPGGRHRLISKDIQPLIDILHLAYFWYTPFKQFRVSPEFKYRFNGLLQFAFRPGLILATWETLMSAGTQCGRMHGAEVYLGGDAHLAPASRETDVNAAEVLPPECRIPDRRWCSR
ncbi:hypothetical protein C8F01DRAFT_1075358 [Mycena amicta]|nr:hypothetical protein C8F01DRAFT_1075358 [Mycena amicta]